MVISKGRFLPDSAQLFVKYADDNMGRGIRAYFEGDPVGVDSPNKCGLSGRPCKDAEGYAVCDLTSGEQRHAEFLVVPDKSGAVRVQLVNGMQQKLPDGARRPISWDNPNTPKNEDEIKTLVKGRVPEQYGYSGVCRSEEAVEVDIGRGFPLKLYRWWMFGGRAEYLAYSSVYNDMRHKGLLGQEHVELTAGEVMALVRSPAFAMSDLDIAIVPGQGPSAPSVGDLDAKGNYRFNGMTRQRLVELSSALQNLEEGIGGIETSRGGEIAGQLVKLLPETGGKAGDTPVELTMGEMMALDLIFGFERGEVECAGGRCYSAGQVGPGAKGRYLIALDMGRLDQMIQVLRDTNVEIDGITHARRQWLAGELTRIKKNTPTYAVHKQPYIMIGMTGAGLVGQVVIIWFVFGKLINRQIKAQKGMMERQMARVEEIAEGKDKVGIGDFTKDMIEEQRKRLATDRALNEILGRDAEALQFLQGLSRPSHANPLLVGTTGVGKDFIVRRAAQLLALGDPRAMHIVRQNRAIAKALEEGRFELLYVDPLAYQAGTKFRGSAADRLLLIVRAMEEGRFVYFPELASFMNAGATSEGAPEGLADQLKEVLEKESSHWSGATTDQGYNRLEHMFPDHMRRLPRVDVAQMPISQVRWIMQNQVRIRYARYYNLEIPDTTVEAAINLGIRYRHLVERGRLPLITAIDETLKDAADLVIREKMINGDAQAASVVTVEHVIRVIEEKIGQSIDPADAAVQIDWDAELKKRAEQAEAKSVPGEASEAPVCIDRQAEGIRFIRNILTGNPNLRILTLGITSDADLDLVAERLHGELSKVPPAEYAGIMTSGQMEQFIAEKAAPLIEEITGDRGGPGGTGGGRGPGRVGEGGARAAERGGNGSSFRTDIFNSLQAEAWFSELISDEKKTVLDAVLEALKDETVRQECTRDGRLTQRGMVKLRQIAKEETGGEDGPLGARAAIFRNQLEGAIELFEAHPSLRSILQPMEATEVRRVVAKQLAAWKALTETERRQILARDGVAATGEAPVISANWVHKRLTDAMRAALSPGGARAQAVSPPITEEQVRAQLEENGLFEGLAPEHQSKLVAGVMQSLGKPGVAARYMKDGRLTDALVVAVRRHLTDASSGRPARPEGPGRPEDHGAERRGRERDGREKGPEGKIR